MNLICRQDKGFFPYSDRFGILAEEQANRPAQDQNKTYDRSANHTVAFASGCSFRRFSFAGGADFR
jgi:hypothetical protein